MNPSFPHLIRWRLRRVLMHLRHPHAQTPIIFANSFPKSGTHLLTQIMSGLPKLAPAAVTGLPAITMYNGITGVENPINEIEAALLRLRPGDINYGHLHAEPQIVRVLTRPGVATTFILRDPRDVVVSHVFYVTDIQGNHAHHAYYTQELHTFEERLQVSILGRPELENPFPDIRGRFAPYMGWLDHPEVLTVRFEDFITDRDVSIGQLLDFLEGRGFAYSISRDQAVGILADQINPEKSPTFRSGKVGSWREHFSPQMTTLFKKVTGDLLIRLGYERDMDW